MVEYLDAGQVIAARRTAERAYQQTASGYGRRLQTTLMVQLADKRWRRVYVACFSNAGTAYVEVKGEWRVIAGDAEYKIEELAKAPRGGIVDLEV